jgi:2-aminoadipate transaminase
VSAEVDLVSVPPAFLGQHERLLRIAAARPEIISFAGGLPDPKLFPRRDLTRAFIAALSRPRAEALQYGWPEGLPALRRHVADCLVQRGARVDPDQVVITSGAQQAIFLTLHAALRSGARIGFEDQSYPGALEAAHAYRAELASLAAHAAAYYVMPSVSNPRGQPLAGAIRDGLLTRARAFRSLVIEDDAYADTVFSGRPARPLLADAPERVFHIGTFSKTLCPGLRVGWIVAPERYVRRVLRAKQNNDLQANGLSQALLAEYLEQGTFDRLKQRARRVYQRRATRLCRSLQDRLPWLRFCEPAGGFSIWIETDSRSKEDTLFELALDEGVSLDLGGAFCRAPSGRLSFRLSFSSVPEDSIDEGVRRLARALHRLGAERTAEAR